MGTILISGTPGSGKSTLAKKLAERIGYKLIEVGKLADEKKAYLGVDKKRDTKIVDERRMANHLERQIKVNKGKVVVSGHYVEIVEPRLVDIVIVLRTHPEELEKRLSQRGWQPSKIKENLQAEILGVCSSNVLTKYERRKIYEIDTTSRSPIQTLEVALSIIRFDGREHAIGAINWLAELQKRSELDKYMIDDKK